MSTPTAKELDQYLGGREAGYESGVENERKLVVSYLRARAAELESLRFTDQAQTVRWAADDIERMLHVSARRAQ